jgi:hypothetical protein
MRAALPIALALFAYEARAEKNWPRREVHVLVGFTAGGTTEAPLSDQELEAKYLQLAAPVLGEDRARGLLLRLRNPEREPSLDFL